MPIDITGKFQPSDHAHGFDLLDAQDIDFTGFTVPSGSIPTVTLAMMATMATSSFLGRITAGTGVPEVLSVANAKTLLNLTGTNSGDQTITLTGDVTGSGTGSFAATIANDAVTYAKMQNVSATDKILGRATAGSGDVEEITCTSFARTFLDDTTATAVRATIGAAGISADQTFTGVNTFIYNTADTLAFTIKEGGAQSNTTDLFSVIGADNHNIFTVNANATLKLLSSFLVPSASAVTHTLPGLTGTVALTNATQTFSGPQIVWASNSFIAGAGTDDEVVPLFKSSLETFFAGVDKPALAIEDTNAGSDPGSGFKYFICPNRTNLTADRYVQLPSTSTSSITLIGTNDTATVTNKTIGSSVITTSTTKFGTSTNYATFDTSLLSGASRTVKIADIATGGMIATDAIVVSWQDDALFYEDELVLLYN